MPGGILIQADIPWGRESFEFSGARSTLSSGLSAAMLATTMATICRRAGRYIFARKGVTSAAGGIGIVLGSCV